MKVWVSANPRKLSRWERELLNNKDNPERFRQINFFGVDNPDLTDQQERQRDDEIQRRLEENETEKCEVKGESFSDK